MGFGANIYGVWDHYYDQKVGQNVGLRARLIQHSSGHEAALIKQLQIDRMITFYPGRMEQ